MPYCSNLRCVSMEFLIFILFLNVMVSHAKFCEKTKTPFELGEWSGSLKHMDSATIENRPVFATEGQVYVYENTFPGYTIRYVNVDNLAQKTCGASAVLKRGGVGTSTVLIILHAATNQEIRSVIDVWGTRDSTRKSITTILKDDGLVKDMKSRYLFRGMRAVNHNSRFITY